jgi:hypothetical protein
VIQPIPWRGLNFFEKALLILMPVLAAGALVLPFLDQAFLRPLSRLPGMRGLVDWLVNSNGSWIAGGLLLVGWAAFVFFERNRLNNDRRLWVDSGCPQCKERELVRVGRQRSDRLYGLIGVKAYRYACRNCTWRGLRIGRRHHAFDEAELAEELRQEEMIAPVDDAVAVELAASLAAVGEPAGPLAATALGGAIAPVVTAPVEAPPAEPVLITEDPDAWTAEDEPLPTEEADQLTRLKADTGLSDEELEWLWRRVSESEAK